MENIKVGDKVFTNGAGNYEAELVAIIKIKDETAYIFNDTGTNYIRTCFKKDLKYNFKETNEEEIEELTVEEISSRLGKTIKVVK